MNVKNAGGRGGSLLAPVSGAPANGPTPMTVDDSTAGMRVGAIGARGPAPSRAAFPESVRPSLLNPQLLPDSLFQRHFTDYAMSGNSMGTLLIELREGSLVPTGEQIADLLTACLKRRKIGDALGLLKCVVQVGLAGEEVRCAADKALQAAGRTVHWTDAASLAASGFFGAETPVKATSLVQRCLNRDELQQLSVAVNRSGDSRGLAERIEVAFELIQKGVLQERTEEGLRCLLPELMRAGTAVSPTMLLRLQQAQSRGMHGITDEAWQALLDEAAAAASNTAATAATS